MTILNFVYFWFFPRSAALFIACYCLSHGSLASAVITWRNSLVFHDQDKVTSLFIHIYAPLSFTVIRCIVRWRICYMKADCCGVGTFILMLLYGSLHCIMYQCSTRGRQCCLAVLSVSTCLCIRYFGPDSMIDAIWQILYWKVGSILACKFHGLTASVVRSC